MATIGLTKIGTRKTLGPGETKTVRWNNPPWDTVLGYTAYPVPPRPEGPHGATFGQVEVTRVVVTWKRDNYDVDKKQVLIDVHNPGDQSTEFDLYESWIAP